MMRIGLHIRIRMDVDVKTQWMRHYLVSARIPLKWQMHFYSEFVQITKEYTKHISVENNIRRNFPTELLPEFLNSFPIIIGYSFKPSYAHGTDGPRSCMVVSKDLETILVNDLCDGHTTLSSRRSGEKSSPSSWHSVALRVLSRVYQTIPHSR